MEQSTFRAMGCEMLVVFDATGPDATRAWPLCRAGSSAGTIPSRFRPSSEFSRLNSQAGRPAQVSAVLGGGSSWRCAWPAAPAA